ncbi:MAG: hypothetical protein IJP54_04515 [Synergistaceae bacterium]|nr:hypothetical protein [Synergistaceae bacterium]MBR0034918.1 hypothetical protein [Synergistaceae bacterium]
MIKPAIFDHDMTIVDSSYAIMEALNFAAKHEGLLLVSQKDYSANTALNGSSYPPQMRNKLPKTARTPLALAMWDEWPI